MYVMFLKQVQTSLGITVYSKFTINAKCISEQWAWTVYSHSLQSNPREAALCSPATVPAGISLNNGMATRIMRNHFRKLQSQTTASHDLSSESRMVLAPLVQRVALMNHPHNSCTAVQTWHFFSVAWRFAIFMSVHLMIQTPICLIHFYLTRLFVLHHPGHDTVLMAPSQRLVVCLPSRQNYPMLPPHSKLIHWRKITRQQSGLPSTQRGSVSSRAQRRMSVNPRRCRCCIWFEIR